MAVAHGARTSSGWRSSCATAWGSVDRITHGFPAHRVRLAERARSPNGCCGVAAHEAFKIAAGNMLSYFGLHVAPVGKKVPR
jgi:hypothetical protein